MSRSPSPSAAEDGATRAPVVAGEPTSSLESRFCPPDMPHVRGDLQQDIIDMLKPIDNDRLKEGMPDTEFNRKYPPDAWCEEAAANARVWKICRDEASAYDRDMLESWNKTLDVLLIFAGLFSAVSTAFIIESYKTLQPDYSQYVATFLYSAAVAYNGSGSALPPLDALRSPEGSFHSSTTERWINGLWFISLAMSLFVALLSILIKQWLDEYRTRVSRSAPDHGYWACRHALYHQGLHSWGVPVIISGLPLLLHISLFLFLAGLVLFLRLLDEVIAVVLLGLVALILGLYVLSMALPAFYLACPSKTPVLTHALRAWSGCLSTLVKLVSPYATCLKTTPLLARIERLVRALAERETRVILDGEDGLTASAVAELVDRTDDPDIMTVVAEAISELPAAALTLFMRERNEAFMRVRQFVYSGTWVTRPLFTRVFALTSFARCHRSRLAFLNVSSNATYLRGGHLLGSPNLAPSLGIEGALLCALYEWDPDFSQNCGIRNLIAALRNIDWIPASQHPFPAGPDYYVPPRTRVGLPICLLFLRTAARIAQMADARDGRGEHPLVYSPHFYSLVVIVYCAARFAAQRGPGVGQGVADECLATIVEASRDVTPAFQVSDSGWIRSRGIDALYTILADMGKYNIHPDVASLVAPYVAALAPDSQYPWSYRQGLSDFIRSEGFARCYTPSAASIIAYAKALSDSYLDGVAGGPQRLKEFLLCADVLVVRTASLDLAPDLYNLLEVIAERLGISSPADEGVLLSHFLADSTMFDRWMHICWRRGDQHTVRAPICVLATRTILAVPLAASLRRRLAQDVDPAWIDVLFSNGVAIRIAKSALDICSSESLGSHEDRAALDCIISFLRHWMQLAPSSWSSMCDHLHNARGESERGRKAVETLRNGMFPGYPGGVAEPACRPSCGCMQPYAHEPDTILTEHAAPIAGESWTDRWRERLNVRLPWTPSAHSFRQDILTETGEV